MSKPSPEAGPLQLLWEQIKQTIRWTRGLVDLDPRTEMNNMQRVLAGNLRVIFLVFRMEVYHRIKTNAQALTLATMLALVPALAVIFAIFRAFAGLESASAQLEEFILENISGSPELQTTISEYLKKFIDNVQHGSLGAISIVILLLSVLSLISHIERAFNTIFGVKTSRPVGVRLLTYWAILTLGPILLGGSLALTAALQSAGAQQMFSSLGWLTTLLVKAAPLMITWAAFSIMYLVIPAARVRFRVAVAAALVAGSLWNLAKAGFAYYARTNVTTQDIYGSLAAIPMFIIWMYVSWLLVLFGCQLAFAFQNAATYQVEHEGEEPAHAARERAAARVMLEVACDFFRGRQPSDHETTARALGMPRKFFESIVLALLQGAFLREVEGGGLVPAQDLARVTIDDVIEYFRTGEGSHPKIAKDDGRLFLDDLFTEMEQERHRVAGNVTFAELAQRFSRRELTDTGAPEAARDRPDVH